MSYDGRLSTYLGTGPVASRPGTPSVPPGMLALWFDPSGPTAYVWDSTASTPQWDLLPAGTTLPSITGNAGKVLTVNAGATGIEWDTPTGGGAAGTPPTIIQSGSIVGGLNPTVALATAPVVGNLLIAMGTHFNNGATTANGYTSLQITNGSNNDGLMIAYKIAVSGESANQVPFNANSGGNNLVVYEISGYTALPTIAQSYQENETANPTLSGILSNSALGVGFFAQDTSSTDFTLDKGTVDTQATGSTPSAGPRRVKGFHILGTGSSVTITATLAAPTDNYGALLNIPGTTGSGSAIVPTFNVGYYGLSGKITDAYSSQGMIFNVSSAIQLLGYGAVMDDIAGAHIDFYIAPFNKGSGQISGTPTHIGTHSPTANGTAVPVFVTPSSPIAVSPGVYMLYIVYTNASNNTTAPGQYGGNTPTISINPAVALDLAPSNTWRLASNAPTTSDTWTNGGATFFYGGQITYSVS